MNTWQRRSMMESCSTEHGPHWKYVQIAESTCFLCEKGIEFKLSGNDVYYTIALILLVKNMLCSRIHCHNVLILFPFHITLIMRVQRFG